MNCKFRPDTTADNVNLIHEIYASGWANVTETSLSVKTPVSQKILVVTSLKKDIQVISVNERNWVELILFRNRLINGIQTILKTEITNGLFNRLRIISEINTCSDIKPDSVDGRICIEREENAKNIAILLVFIRRLFKKNEQEILAQDLICRKLRDDFQLKIPPLNVKITSPGYSKLSGNFLDKLNIAIRNDRVNNIYTILPNSNSKSSYMVSRTKNIKDEIQHTLDHIGDYLNSENIIDYKAGCRSGKLWDRYKVYPNHEALQHEFKYNENAIFKLFDRSINNPHDSECLTDYPLVMGGVKDARIVDSVIWLATILNCSYRKAHDLILLFLRTDQTIHNAVFGSFGSKASIIGAICIWIANGGSDKLHNTDCKLLKTELDGTFSLTPEVLKFVVRRCNAIELIHDCTKDDVFSFHSHIGHMCEVNNSHHHGKTINCNEQPGIENLIDSSLFPYTYQNALINHDVLGTNSTTTNNSDHLNCSHGHSHNASGTIIVNSNSINHNIYGHSHDASGKITINSPPIHHNVYGHSHDASGTINFNSPPDHYHVHGHGHNASGGIVLNNSSDLITGDHTHNISGGITHLSSKLVYTVPTHTHDASGGILSTIPAHTHSASGLIISLIADIPPHSHDLSGNSISTANNIPPHIHNISGVVISTVPTHTHSSTGAIVSWNPNIPEHSHASRVPMNNYSYPHSHYVNPCNQFTPSIKAANITVPDKRYLGHNYAFNERPTVAKDASGVSIIRGKDIYNKLNALIDFYKLYHMDLYSIKILVEIIQAGEYSFANYLASEYKTSPERVSKLINARNNRIGPFQYIKLNGDLDFHYTRKNPVIGSEGFLISVRNDRLINTPLTYAEFLNIFCIKWNRIWINAEKSAIDVLTIYLIEWANNLDNVIWIKNVWDLIIIDIGVFPDGLLWNEYRRENLLIVLDAIWEKGGLLVESSQTRKIKRAILDIR